MKKSFSLLIALLFICSSLCACKTKNNINNNQTNSNEITSETKEYNEMKSINNSFEKIYFLGKTNKNPLEYTSGEEMIFTVTLYGDGEVINAPYFRYEVTADDGSKKTGLVEVENGSADIPARCTVPGYARVKVFPCDENKTVLSESNISIFEGGACADFDSIKQTNPEPQNFDEFWDAQRKIIEGIEPKLLESVKIDDAPAGFDVYDIKVKCVDGSKPVSAYVSIPQNAKSESCKFRIGFQGYGVASSSVSVREGYISLHMNPHGIENGKKQEYYDALRTGELSGFGFKNNTPPENSYFRNMILRDIQAMRFLMIQYKDLWNGKDFEVEGGSMGAFQSTAVSSIMNDVVTKLTINIPWLCDLGSENAGRLNGWRPSYNEGIAYYDTVNFAKRVKAPVAITAGLGDYICPPSGITVLYHSFKCPKTLTFIQNKTHSYNPVEIISYKK